ncbi:hypothetical protein ES703_35499 [subsurface metagenome]
MSNIKRKLKRRQKGNIKSPVAESFHEDGYFMTSIYYNGKIGCTLMPDIDISDSDLRLMDRDITEAFKRLPWKGLDDLLKIADFMLDECLCETSKIVKEGQRPVIPEPYLKKNPPGLMIKSKILLKKGLDLLLSDLGGPQQK